MFYVPAKTVSNTPTANSIHTIRKTEIKNKSKITRLFRCLTSCNNRDTPTDNTNSIKPIIKKSTPDHLTSPCAYIPIKGINKRLSIEMNKIKKRFTFSLWQFVKSNELVTNAQIIKTMS